MLKRLEGQDGPGLLGRLPSMPAIAGASWFAGNRLTLLVDRPGIYEAMFRAISSARDHINLETFIFENGEVGTRFAEVLLKKQAGGVQVNLIYDGFGSRFTPAAFFQRLRRAGARTLEFHPLNPLQAGGSWAEADRDHRKMLIVDGRVAFLGSINFDRLYPSAPIEGRPAGSRTPWRDTDMEIEGPAVAELQRLFLETWRRWGGGDPPLRNPFPVLKAEGEELVQVVASGPGPWNRGTYLMYLAAFACATRSIRLTNAFFVPDRQLLEALTSAARRGVEVEVLFPRISELPLLRKAGRSFYPDLWRAGVKVYEREGAVLHAKTAVVDGIWSTVGSTNLEMWSLARNNEVNVAVLGRNFARQMEDLFTLDRRESKRLRPENREEPSFLKRWYYGLLAPLL